MKHPVKRLLLLALVPVLALFFGSARADGPISDESGFIRAVDAARSKRQTSFQLSCSPALFRAILDDLFVYEVKSGISSADVRYSSDRYTFYFENVCYDAAPRTECSDRDGLKKAVTGYLEKGITHFSLICPPALAQSVFDDGYLCYCAALAGAEDAEFSYYLSNGVIRLESAGFTSLPVSPVSDPQDFLDAVRAYGQEGISTFRLVLSPDMFARIQDSAYLRSLISMSVITTYSYSWRGSYNTLTFTSVAYSFAPRIRCSSAEDVESAIRSMGTAGTRSFGLVLDEATYASLTARNFKALNRLQADAGMTGYSLIYMDSLGLLLYSDASIVPNSKRLTTPEEARRAILSAVDGCDSSVTLICTDDLYALLMNGGRLKPINDLCAEAGIFEPMITYQQEQGIISLRTDTLYPGVRIMQSLQGKNVSLTPDEVSALASARRIVSETSGLSEAETAQYLHDRLCEMTVYRIDDSTTRYDTAIGPLLDGYANCDGYADAYYLLCRLAGLEAGFFHGDALRPEDRSDDATHMWNTLRLNGTLFSVDATWDDREDEPIAHLWFGIGLDRMSRGYIWNAVTAPDIVSVTPASGRPKGEYLISHAGEAARVVQQALSRGETELTLVFASPSAAADYMDAVHAMNGCTFSYNDRIPALRLWK